MDNPLQPLLDEGIISEVLGRLQSGKEAEVFLVRYAERVVAAKVYKDRTQRSFKNKAAYQEGRSVRNSRDQRAMGRRSSFGKDTEEEAWKSAEVDAMYKLHAADVRIPAPVLFFEGVLLMDLVVDAEGVTARRLIDTTLSAEQAHAAYHDMLVQLVRMLSCDLIHGDLSPYNVLWAAGGPTIIDFPQIVSAAQNSNSERFFLRDAENILGHFRAIDPRLAARRGDAAEIWRAYMRRELTSDFKPTGRLQQPPPQRPLPINVARPAGGPPQQQPQRDFRPPQQQPRGARALQPQRDGRPQQQPQPQRDVRPPQQQQRGIRSQPQPQRDGRAQPQPQRDGRAQSQPQRGALQQPRQHSAGAPPWQSRGGAAQQQRHAARPSGQAQGRRPAPEVIVRPRVAPGAPPRAARPTELAEPAVDADRARKPDSKRG